ncbi:Protein CBR-DMD-8 [Caenorhabditis briggsae]|uniref:Protein CBR-DMD-8 n=1 Tax=Caenorhabditis briggsae TaxID=6238 RepID=A8WQA1_CAEBR|nr:Protein CBR-DMD-8 [Caenorhabditis briggsae]CAP22659.2 Protein CBR-DMD-8 [Caenorhabditis briggsae]
MLSNSSSSSSNSSSNDSSSSLSAGSPPKGSLSPDGGAQRFFSQGKRIPKDVKRHCGMCKQHGVIVETRGHTCEFKNCGCEHCDLVRKRREIMSTQIRLRREQDKKFQRTTDITEANVFPGFTVGEPIDEKAALETMNMCYFCQKCKNHNVLIWKKNHKKDCKYKDCECEQCNLIDSRRALDRHIKKRKINLKENVVEGTAPKSPKKDQDSSNSASSSSLSSSTCNSDESGSSDSSLSGLLTEKLKMTPQVQVKFDFSTGGFVAPSATVTTSPSVSPYETPSPLPLISLPHSPAPMASLPQVSLPSTLPLPFLTVPSLLTTAAATNPFFSSSLMYTTASNLFTNPFLMPITPIDMQMLFQNIQNIRDMTAAMTMTDTD